MNSDTIKVSIIMPSLNVQPYIRECLESVVRQTLKEIEIICVDAGSTDGTLDVLREFEDSDYRVHVLHSEKKSYGYQVNMGLDAARGAYIGIVETDDYISPKMYQCLYRIAERDHLDFVKGDYYRFYGDSENRTFEYTDIAEYDDYFRILNPSVDPMIMRDGRTIYTWAGLYRSSFLRNNNILHNESPGASYQDNGFWFQVFSQACRARFINNPLYFLRRDNPGSSFFSKNKVYCICDEYDYIRSFITNTTSVDPRFLTMCAYRRFENYIFTLSRISPKYHLEFLHRFSADFNAIKKNGELDRNLYSSVQWLMLEEIIADPDMFYQNNMPFNIYSYYERMQDEVSQSKSKIQKATHYLRRNGLSETVHHYGTRGIKVISKQIRSKK